MNFYLSFWSCDSCRHLRKPRHHSFLFKHWSASKCLVFMAARTPSIHVFLGRPLFLLSPGIHSIINFGSLLSCILLTWPYHCSLFLYMMSIMSGFSFTPMMNLQTKKLPNKYATFKTKMKQIWQLHLPSHMTNFKTTFFLQQTWCS